MAHLNFTLNTNTNPPTPRDRARHPGEQLYVQVGTAGETSRAAGPGGGGIGGRTEPQPP
jgi:hypothetical protein